ncbi:histone-lysine N-methyltransferase SETMAR [Plakobranchus ocellatus]|uniref:Histone-lysine N-methyltransferase SETMAR n=1 Tax=Plakobranchus ocellatus TaxID=259542 RepID=A0AAV3XRS7_9GAST|nr:histone-lysine N-methyltransferase SETMAR [Plakobranchus ocellatus]
MAGCENDKFFSSLLLSTGLYHWSSFDQERSLSDLVENAMFTRQSTVLQYRDAKGVILSDILPQGQCINAARYCSTLDRLKEAIRRKRPGLFETEDDLISELRNWFDNLDVDFFRGHQASAHTNPIIMYAIRYHSIPGRQADAFAGLRAMHDKRQYLREVKFEREKVITSQVARIHYKIYLLFLAYLYI